MNNTKNKLQRYILIFSLLFITTVGFAQNSQLNELPGFSRGQNDSGTAAPISSLVALGLIAGAAYGIKKMR